ncbi:MAG TPA: hypothetical protein VGL13_06710, partial [Polyangiaceae bacterium]
SPEQASAERDLDGRSDIYSLGCVLYEMLAGVPPFVGPSARAIIARHMTEPAPNILASRADLPAGAGVLLSRMLAKSPSSRPPTAAVLIHDIDRYETLESEVATSWWRVFTRLFRGLRRR